MSLRLFAGFDKRESPGFHTFLHSAIKRTSVPLQINPIDSSGIAQGTNSFTYSRFMVPFRCAYRGRAMFLDGADMLCMEDLAELDKLFDPKYAVQVVKHPDYTSQHARKYVGTEMECAQTITRARTGLQ